ncbi:hypothetical protein AC579_5754 [Pseudocercospora musae]|uniref:Uncharacterized protein n=1 Tax=Pseudocercospora musae TaxID=113226 RepID=A0A139IRR7_9PEZI|nr:hypothetical protein AC579_5754 [Pseudocercospora musae]
MQERTAPYNTSQFVNVAQHNVEHPLRDCNEIPNSWDEAWPNGKVYTTIVMSTRLLRLSQAFACVKRLRACTLVPQALKSTGWQSVKCLRQGVST